MLLRTTRSFNVILAGKRSFASIASISDHSFPESRNRYQPINFKISENATVMNAIRRLSSSNVGCLVTTDAKGNASGLISERDIINKVGALDRLADEVKICEIATPFNNVVLAKPCDSINDCMSKMIENDIRHLPVVSDNNGVVALLSILDCVKACVEEQDMEIELLSRFSQGLYSVH